MKTINTSILIPANAEQIWACLIDFESHARWNPFFASIEGEAVVGTTLVVTARKGEGTGMTFKPTVLEVEANRLLTWKGQLFMPGIFDGTHSFRLEPTAEGTILHHGEKFGGVLIPFMGKVLRETEQGFRDFNEALLSEVMERAGTQANTDEPCSGQ